MACAAPSVRPSAVPDPAAITVPRPVHTVQPPAFQVVFRRSTAVNYSVKNPVPGVVSSWVGTPPQAGSAENVDEGLVAPGSFGLGG